MLHNSVCDSPAVAKLNVYLGTHVVPRATLEAAPEWHAFLGSLHSASLKSKEIPGEAFVKGMNPEGFTWADLAGLPDVLDIKFAAARPGEDKVLDSAAQARMDLLGAPLGRRRMTCLLNVKPTSSSPPSSCALIDLSAGCVPRALMHPHLSPGDSTLPPGPLGSTVG